MTELELKFRYAKDEKSSTRHVTFAIRLLSMH